MKSREVRSIFRNFFESKNHKIIDSAPLPTKTDPTLMFTNAGMNQFKDYFLGNEIPNNKRVANFQKCLRVSGKHNDLDEVGEDTYHHTMFEMMGNWSFGDYFKKEAITWAWELLVDHLKLDPERLYVTVFGGDITDKLDADDEAISFWKEIIPESHILKCSKKDNFWEMGETGPCGPCSEIHVDLRTDAEITKNPSRDLVNKDHPQVIELWNLVFIQFERLKNGELHNLPQKHIDTGMGFERLVRVLQGKQSNYDTDLFLPLISSLERISGKPYIERDINGKAFRVIADHIRAITFSIADGQLPSNNGAGYVIRRILRRAVRYAYSFMDISEPFLYKTCEVLINEYKEYYPELRKQEEFIIKVIKEEETQFYKTLSRGIQMFQKEVKRTEEKMLSGSFAFELYDTYGFPFDLTTLMSEEINLKVDKAAFDKKLQEQKTRSRASGKIDASDWVDVTPTESTVFVGYDELKIEAKVIKYRKVKQKDKEFYQIVLDRTPFYPEGGGQVGDKGVLNFEGEVIAVFETKRENNLVVHYINKLPENIESNLLAEVDIKERGMIIKNHSATHLLQLALRDILGPHVEQRGSLVNSKSLRFDFSHFEALSDNDIIKINKYVNNKIFENLELLEKREMPISEAKAMGAMALFGEKYGDQVRVIKFGPSIELCGGVHVKNTSEIGGFKIISEGSVAAGIRRVEAITGLKLQEFNDNESKLLNEIKEQLKNPKDIKKALLSLINDNNSLRKDIASFQNEKTKNIKGELVQGMENVNNIKFIGKKIDLPSSHIKDLVFQLKSDFDDLLLVLGSESNGRIQLTVALSEKLSKEKGLKASTIIKEAAKLINGGGGGQDYYATAGGSKPEAFREVVEKCKSFLE